ncbi:MAG: hypothetical protein WCJ64_11560 [Rhodospirillaceae bacterium]
MPDLGDFAGGALAGAGGGGSTSAVAAGPFLYYAIETKSNIK